MIYVMQIDWLSVFCIYTGSDIWEPRDTPQFTYKKEDFGTRVFSRFYRVRRANAAGGWDEFAEIQADPYSSILPPYAVIVRFVNRVLYLPDFWDVSGEMLCENRFDCRGISRIDICADFNNFACMSPKALIEGFAAKKYRHIGRGVGALYFNHGIGAERDAADKPTRDYGVNYTGLSFGTHSSDARVYLYNKTFELLTQGDKPWIKDTWRNAGLDMRNVWRLEVSIKSQGLKFKDKKSGQVICIDIPLVGEESELCKIFHTFERKLFAFIHNKSKISNVSREPRLTLFDDSIPVYDRGSIQNLSPGNRMERIIIKSLYQYADKYRVCYGIKDAAQEFASNLAAATGLYYWLQEKKEEWETPIHK